MLLSTGKRLSVLVSGLIILFGLVTPVAAQQGPNNGGSGLSISPTRYDLQVDPGKSSEIKIDIKNISGADIEAKVAINDFTSDGQTGQPRIITNPKQVIPQSIRNFLDAVGDVPLKKDETKNITIKLQVPQNTPPGAYYGIIRYSAVRQGADQNQGNNVSLTASVGVVVLLTVPGTIKQQVQVLNVAAFNDTLANNSSSFYLKPPKAAGVTINNLGNGFADPFGNVVVSDMFGKQVYSYQLNGTTPRSVVLPGSTRNFKDSVQNIKKPGRYTLTANVSYGNGGEIIVVKSAFWYLPVWIIFILVVLLAALIALCYVLYRRLSRRQTKSRRK